MRRSRYVRPELPSSGLILQDRDLALLRAVHQHRFVRTEHLQRLLFENVNAKIPQVRLRKLWEHRFLERYYQPCFLDGVHKPPRGLYTPTYALSDRGAGFLAEQLRVAPEDVPRGFGESVLAAVTLEHDLITTDFLVALACALRGRHEARLEESLAEWALWQRLHARRAAGETTARSIVPDGAFTLTPENGGVRFTFYLEVVRADVKGGNSTLRDKLARYVTLHRQGFFREAYGHDRVRAVLVLTTSEERALHFRELADELPHGRRLFWFGVYQDPGLDGRPVSRLMPETILTMPFESAGGERVTILSALTAPGAVPLAPLHDHAHALHHHPDDNRTPSAAPRSRGDGLPERTPALRAPAGGSPPPSLDGRQDRSREVDLDRQPGDPGP